MSERSIPDTVFPANALLPTQAASLGEILDAGFVLFRRSLLRCVPFSLLAVLFGQLPSVYQLQSAQSLALLAPKDVLWWVLMLLAGLGTLWSWLVIMRRQSGLLRSSAGVSAAATSSGDDGSLRGDVVAATASLPRALGLLLAATIAVGLGALLLVLPGIYLLVAFWPALAIMVFEGKGVRDSLDGALRLVRGSWRHTASVLLVAAISVLALFVIGSMLGLLLMQVTSSAGAINDQLVSAIVGGVLGALFQPLVIAFSLAMYADLSNRSAQAVSSASNSA